MSRFFEYGCAFLFLLAGVAAVAIVFYGALNLSTVRFDVPIWVWLILGVCVIPFVVHYVRRGQSDFSALLRRPEALLKTAPSVTAPPVIGDATPIILIFFFAACALLYGTWVAIKWVIASGVTAQTINTLWGKIAISIGLVIAASIMAICRLRAQAFYGMVEAVFGFAISWRSLDSLGQQLATDPNLNSSVLPKLTILGASVYLIGRGLVNLFDGTEKMEQRDSQAKALAQPEGV